jgi:hypothetical protein
VTEIFVERHWEKPLTASDMQTLVETSGGCLAAHRCDWRGSLLSADGHELVCRFSAPDAESVRMALHDAGSPRGSVWAGTIHDATGLTEEDLMQAGVVVVRRFAEPAEFAVIQALEEASAGCLDTHRVRFVRTYFSMDRRRMICLYRAPDAESVRMAQREAGMPVERVWAFRWFK